MFVNIVRYTSKKNPPTTSFDVIKAYSNHFKVTADYLLGLRDTKPIDENIAMINKVTGLDENAINTLKKISNEDIDILNFIMKDFFTFYCFLSNIKNFISGDFDTPIYFERDKNGKGYNKSNSAPRWNTCLYPAGSRTDGNISKCTDADAYGAWETCI